MILWVNFYPQFQQGINMKFIKDGACTFCNQSPSGNGIRIFNKVKWVCKTCSDTYINGVKNGLTQAQDRLREAGVSEEVISLIK